jgi:hypothetical protein
MCGKDGGATGIDHSPVFVLTNHPRASITMSGGTIFHFVTDGIHAALERSVDAAKGQDIPLGGGVATIRQYLCAGLIDELRGKTELRFCWECQPNHLGAHRLE